MVEGRDVQAGAVERPGQTGDDGASIGWKWSIGRADVTHLNGEQGKSTSVSEAPQGAPRETGRRGTVYMKKKNIRWPDRTSVKLLSLCKFVQV